MIPTPVFDAYLIVDWSASNAPTTGKDSIWYAVVERMSDGKLVASPPVNPSTRWRARQEISNLLIDFLKRDRRVLVGCDFPYALPAGTAMALGLNTSAPWRAVWNYLAGTITDSPKNLNNRFDVAAAMNQAISGRAFPFWCCPAPAAGPTLTVKKPSREPHDRIEEWRIADRHASGAQSPWKLYTAGSVGSQALMGIPVVASWRDHPELAARSQVWPFETGLRVLERPAAEGWRILHAEIFPSLLNLQAVPGEVKDAAQVRSLARQLATLDEQGHLAARFAGPATLADLERRRIEHEEGWILDPKDGEASDSAVPHGMVERPDTIRIIVEGPPPAKDGAKSIFSPDHLHHPYVAALRAAVLDAMVGRAAFEGVPLRLEVTYRRAKGRADALNLVNGIADVLQRRHTSLAYANEAWVFDDDVNIREFHYREHPSNTDSYEILVAPKTEVCERETTVAVRSTRSGVGMGDGSGDTTTAAGEDAGTTVGRGGSASGEATSP